jgi:predicted transposase/invertase (TIGR01784 family)
MNTHHPKNVHDAYFTWFTNNTSYARQLLSCILPPQLLEELDLNTLRIVPPDQTDSRLRRHRSDVLFELQTRSGKPLLIYLLLEHKSRHDPKASFQVLRYIIHRAEDWLRQRQPLHCILPVVLYNGRKPWKTARSLHEIFNVPPKCGTLFPQFRVSVLDLPRMEDKTLRGSEDFLASARLLRCGLQPDLALQLPTIFTGLKDRLLEASNGHEADESPLPAILSYASSRINRIELEQIIEQTFKDNPMLKAQMMKSAAEEWYEEGLVKGREEGREEGMLIGQIRTLQQVFNLAVTPETELRNLALEQLQTRLNQVQTARRRTPDS